MSSHSTASAPGRSSLSERLLAGVCDRAFSSPEAFLYELLIAPALARIVAPILETALHGSSILDVGCGGGRVALATSNGGARQVVGVDPSSSQVRRYARRTKGRSPAVRGRGESLPFHDGSFDSVYSSCVYKHWPDPGMAIDECARVVRPGGSVVTVELDGASGAAEFRAFADRSRIPRPLRDAYVRFALRTVVAVAPTLDQLGVSFEGHGLVGLTVTKIDALPFLAATGTVVCS